MVKQEVKPDWRFMRVDQTQHCDAAWLEKKGIAKLGMIYLVDANLHVHICSLTPCLEAWPVQSFVDFKTAEAAELDEGESELEVLNSEEPVSYFDTNWLRDSVSAATYAPKRDADESFEDYRIRAADEVREHCAGNPICFETLRRREAKMSEKKTARLVPVLVEKRGKWVAGFKILSPDTGNELQPYMTAKDARAFCKAQGWEVEHV